MAEFREDTIFYPMALDMASCLCREIEAAGLPATCFCGIVPGELVALDYCTPCEGDQCGMAWVRLAAVGPMDTTESDLGPLGRNCNILLSANFEVGVIRCAPTMGEDGSPPSMADQLASARLQMADMNAAFRAAACCQGDSLRHKDIQVLSWTPMGPQGGCVGGSWSVLVSEV